MPQSAGLDSLSPPPRTVPARLRRQIWTGTAFCVTSVLFGVASVFAVSFANPIEFAAATLLLFARREAAATVTATENTKWTVNETPVFRHRYSFKLPEGAVHEGRSYTTGPKKLPKHAKVHYHPEQPWASALEGTRPTRFGWLVLFVYAFPGIAFLTVVGTIMQLRATIHLLAHGFVGRATLTSCFVRRNETTEAVAFGEYRRQWLAAKEAAEVAGAGNGDLPGRVPGAGLFSCLVVMILGFGVIFVVVALALVWLMDVPFNVNGRPVGRGVATLVLLAFLAIWCAVGYGMLWFGRSVATRTPSAGPAAEQVEVEFQFELPGGATATCRRPVDFDEHLGDEATEPILYDPDRPDKALLLDSIRPRVVVTPMGGWDTAEEQRTLLRALAIAAGLLGGPILSCFVVFWMS